MQGWWSWRSHRKMRINTTFVKLTKDALLGSSNLMPGHELCTAPNIRISFSLDNLILGKNHYRYMNEGAKLAIELICYATIYYSFAQCLNSSLTLEFSDISCEAMWHLRFPGYWSSFCVRWTLVVRTRKFSPLDINFYLDFQVMSWIM